jgi:pimeloyl-ACP methyl ester carboxylesterase
MEFHTVGLTDQRFVVSQAGSGPDIVLLHGFPDTPYTWVDLQSTLVGAGWRVSVPWLRGYHPETIVPGRPYDPEALGRDALALLDALDISSAVLVGHDWGALLAYVAATLAPERIRGIVTCDIPHPSLVKPTPQALWSARHVIALKMPWAGWHCRRKSFAYIDVIYQRFAGRWSGAERDEGIRRVKEALCSPETLAGAISYYRDLPRRMPDAAEKAGAVPGLIIGGDENRSVEGLFERTAELLPGPSRALVVEGSGHWPQREHPDIVTPEILAFLSELDA